MVKYAGSLKIKRSNETKKKYTPGTLKYDYSNFCLYCIQQFCSTVSKRHHVMLRSIRIRIKKTNFKKKCPNIIVLLTQYQKLTSKDDCSMIYVLDKTILHHSKSDSNDMQDSFFFFKLTHLLELPHNEVVIL